MIYYDLFKSFYESDVQYLLVGGIALNLHGVPRTTYDLDIIISMDQVNVAKVNRLLKNFGYIPRLPVDPALLSDEQTVRSWIEEKNMKAFSFYHETQAFRMVDIVLDYPLNFDESFKRRERRNVGQIEINLIAREDLLIMKRSSTRPKDRSDTAMLEEVKRIDAERT